MNTIPTTLIDTSSLKNLGYKFAEYVKRKVLRKKQSSCERTIAYPNSTKKKRSANRI